MSVRTTFRGGGCDDCGGGECSCSSQRPWAKPVDNGYGGYDSRLGKITETRTLSDGTPFHVLKPGFSVSPEASGTGERERDDRLGPMPSLNQFRRR